MEMPSVSGNVSKSSSVPNKPAEPGKGTGDGVKMILWDITVKEKDPCREAEIARGRMGAWNIQNM